MAGREHNSRPNAVACGEDAVKRDVVHETIVTRDEPPILPHHGFCREQSGPRMRENRVTMSKEPNGSTPTSLERILAIALGVAVLAAVAGVMTSGRRPALIREDEPKDLIGEPFQIQPGDPPPFYGGRPDGAMQRPPKSEDH